MKKLIFATFIFALITIIASHADAQAIWTKKANFPGVSRYFDEGFSIGHYGFVGGGKNSSNTTLNDFYKWDQLTNMWTRIADYPGAGATITISATIEGSAYVGLGVIDPPNIGQQDLWKYDTAANSWTKMASLPASGRYDPAYFTIGYKIYVIGGSTGGPPYLNDAWVYNTHTNTWKQLNNSPALTTIDMVAFSIGAHGYIGGGWNSSSAQSACWQYDTTNDAWSSIAALPIPMYGNPHAFVLGRKGYVCTGQGSNSKPIPAGYVYDTLTKAWSVFTNMGTYGIERYHAIAFSIGNFGYIGTGIDSLGNLLTDFWQYGIDCINGSPVVTSSRDSICYGTGVTSELSATGGSGNFQWQNSTDGIHYYSISAANSTTYTTPKTLTQTTFYRVVGGSGSCDTSNSVTVKILSAPQVSFNYTVNGNNISFITDSASSNITTYAWDFGDNQRSNETNPAHIFNSDSTYYVCLTVYNGSNCSFTYCKYVSLLTGIRNVSDNSFILLYPDPVGSTIHLSANEPTGQYKVMIYNIFGQEVYSNSFKEKDISIDISAFAEGSYFMMVNNVGRLITQRFMVKH